MSVGLITIMLGVGVGLSLALWAYLRRPPAPRQVVSSLLIWRRVVGASVALRRRARVTRWLSFALVCAALLAVGLALAVGGSVGPPVLILMDDSASMAAAAGGQSRLSQARDLLAGQLVGGGPFTLVTTSPPTVRLLDAADPQQVRLSARSLRPSGAGGDVSAILEAQCARSPTPVLLWLSDQPAPDLPCVIRSFDMGEEGVNHALSALAVRRADALGLTEVWVAGDGSEGLVVELWTGEDTVLGRVAPGLHAFTLPDALDVSARVVSAPRGDALPADDVLSVALPAPKAVRTLLYGGEARGYLATALSVHPAVELHHTPSDVPPPAGPWDLLVVVERGEAVLPSATHTAVLGIDGAEWGVPWGAPLSPGPLRGLTGGEGLMRRVDLEGVRQRDGHSLRAPADSLVLLSSSAGPLAVSRDADSGAVLVMGVGLVGGDFPLRVDFVHLIANLVEWADDAGLAAVQTSAHPQSELRVPAVPGEKPGRGWPSPSAWLLLALAALLAEAAGLAVARRRR